MPITWKIKTAYAAVVVTAQIYLVYAATLYVDLHSPAMRYVFATAALSALGAVYYVFVAADKDVVGGYNEAFTADKRR